MMCVVLLCLRHKISTESVGDAGEDECNFMDDYYSFITIYFPLLDEYFE